MPKSEIDELYWNNPYYITPDGEAGSQAFAVIREAIKKENSVALGRVVFTTREHAVAIEARGKGLLGVTLRYPYEVRSENDYFGDLPDEKISKDMLDLAVHIIATKAGHFEPEKFEDHYESALRELIKKKQLGEKIEKPKERAPAQVVNFMDALRQSIAAEHRVASSHPRRTPALTKGTPSRGSKARVRTAG